MSVYEALDVTAYLETVRREIDRRNAYPFSCGLIAIDLAKILLDQGAEPQIAGLRGQPKDSAGNTKPLLPRRFGGKIEWGAHLVCTDGALAYDPIIAQPMAFDRYLEEEFMERPEDRRRFHGKELLELIERRQQILRDARDNAPFIMITDIEQLSIGNQ